MAFESLSIAAAVDEPDNSDQQQTIAVKDISGNNNLVFSIAGMEETQDELAYNLSLDFMVENPQGDYKVNPGDKFSFSLPSDIFTAEDTQEAVAIYSESSASFGDIKTEVKGEKIAEYTVKSQVVEVVFCDYIEQVENIQSLFGRIMIKINLMRKALTFEEQKSKWDIQTLEDGTVRSLEIQLPARQTVEWSERTEQFTVSQTDNGENEKTVQFSFNESKDKFPPMEGDTAVIAVGEEWQIKSEKIDAEPAEAENAEESEAEKSVVTNYLLVEGNTEPFASYKLENGNLVITFEKEVENIDDISKINGQISLEKIPEPTEEETAKTTEEITTEEVTEPVTEETTETEPTEKPSEAVSNSVSNSDVSLLADDYDIDENGVLIKFTAYNSQAVEQDIYWIDNNDSNNVRPGVDDVREQLYNNVKFTATYTYTENDQVYTGTFTRTLAELGVDKNKVTVIDLGGTGHYIFNVASSGLPSAAKITVEDKTYENIKLTWDYTLDTELYRDQYYYVDVNENTVDQWPSSGENFGWYFSKSMDYSIDIEVRHGQQAMYGIDEVIADLYHFYYVTNVYVEGELVEDHSAISDLTSRNDIVWGEWDYDTNTFKGTNTFTVKHLPKKFISDLENLGYKLVLKLEFAPGYEDKGYIDYEDNTVTLVNEKVPIKDDNNNYVSAVQDVSKETANSTYYFWNLPKYDEFGTLVRYQVTEYVYDEANDKCYSLAELKANGIGIIDTEYNSNSYQVSYELSEGQHKNDKQGVAVTNGLSGSKEIFFRKEWKDAYRYKNGERPDIYLDLYRVIHVKDEDGNVVEKIENIYSDRKWSFHNDVNYSTCNFGSMPKYDSLGYEIFYYAREKMRINKEIFDYTEVEYKYWGDPSDDLVIDEEHPNWEEYRDIGTEYGGLLSTEKDKTLLREYVENGEKVYLLKERGMFVNKIAANVTIDGKKIWANLPSGFLQADLPEVKFSIYQFIEDTDPGNDEDLNQETPIATLTVNDWSKQLVKGEYHFMISYDGENTNSIDSEGNLVAEPVGADQGRLPKYDDNGELHIYRLREEVIGLNGSDANDIKLVFKQPVINNYAITNGYNPQLGSISVRKWLDTTPFNDDEEKPTIYFALTRTYKNDEGNVVSDPHFIQVMKMDYKDFVNGVADITFKDLPIYAPNGNYYTYKVAENANKLMQGGYDMTAGIGFLAKNSSGYTVSDVNDDGIVEVDGLIAIPNDADGNPPAQTTDPDPNAENWATFKNVYNTGDDAALYFGKEWVDNNNTNGSRPKTLTFEIYRSADAQSGQGNAIAETKIGTFTVDLTQYWNQNTAYKTAVNIAADSIDMVKDLNISIISASGNSAEWTGTGDFATSKYWLFQLEGLEIYAPNSMPWKYKITEIDTGLNGYNIAIGSDGVQFTYSKGTNSYNTMGNAISKLFKNSVETSYTMWKNWRKDIGDFQNSTNKTGYNIKLDSTLYVAGVQAKPDGTAPDAEQYNVLDLWKTVTSSEFKDILSAYNVQENRSVTINNGATLGAKNAASSIFAEHLPVTVMYNGNVYYLKYYMIESKLSFINSSNATVYYEEFTPTFKLYDEKGKDYPDVSRIGFYLDTQSYILKDTINDIYEETALNIFEPVVSSEEILNNIHDAGLRSVYTNTQDITTDKSIYPYINFYDGNTKKESTFVNLYGETNLKAEKTWVDDAENIYGTREPNGSGWKMVFNIQYKDKNDPSSSWENFKYGSNAAAITITGENSEDNKSNTVTNLPVLGVLPNEDNTGYDIVEFEYCAREVYNSIVINNEEIYRDIYKAIYDADTQPDAENNLYTSSVTNHMITIELEATKNWEDTYGEITPIDMISPVTFELQYQDTAGQWTSFKTPAKVTLNGEPDDVDQSDLPAYYEDIAWHAVWNFVPKVMPGSATTGEGDAKQTIYRIVETSENAYPTNSDYILGEDETTSEPNDYTITNELTELRIEKVVEKYVDGAVVNDKFTFTISGDMDNINLYYKKYNKGNGAAVQDELAEQGQMVVVSGKTNFELSDNQYIVIYGLKKGKTYTITENSGKYTAFYKVNNGTETEGNTASVTIPNSKPADMDYVLFTNKRFGKITINKVDENDKKLNGATFLLEKKVNDSATGTESWEEVERKVTGADGVDGVAVFDKLDLNVNYKITELSSADGYNKLINPIEVYLPLGSDTKGENPLYDTEINGLYYYAEITYTIGNNASLEIPTTGGSGFFNPGILGVSALILVAFFYVIREDRKRRKAKSKL